MDFEEARERRRRTQTVRLGLMICFILIMIDYLNSPPVNAHGTPSHAVSSIDKIETTSYLKENETNAINSRLISTAPMVNISTIYRGTWSAFVDDEATDPSWKVKTSRVSGDMLMQLRTLPVTGTPNINFVYGVLKLSGIQSLRHTENGDFLKDAYYPVQGVYLNRENELAVSLTPSRGVRVFLSVPNKNSVSRQAIAFLSDISKQQFNEKRSLHVHGGLDKSVADIPWKEIEDFLGNFLDWIGNGGKVLNRIRTNVNQAMQFLSSTRVAHEYSEFMPPEAEIGDAGSTFRFKASNDRKRQLYLLNDSSIFNGIIPKSSLSSSIESSLDILTSTRIGTSGISLVAARLGASAMRTGSTPVGFGDDILPSTFKSMQLSLGPTLDSLCSSGTVISLSRSGGTVVSSSSGSKTTLVKKMIGQVKGGGCGIRLNATLIEYHIDVEKLGSKVSLYSTVIMAICAAQIYLLIVQMKFAEPQGAIARTSMLTIGSQALLDAVLCVGHLLMSVAIPSVFFYYFMWIAILKLVIYSVLEMRMIIGIYRARNLQNVEINNAMALRRYLSIIHTRFFIALFTAMLTVNIFYDRPVMLIFAFYSFWIPQICYNAYEGTKQPFVPYFAVCITITRLFVPLYIFGCPENFLSDLLGEEIVSAGTCFLLVSWLGIQLLVLELQARLGSRFFIPKRFLPVPYDYRRPIVSRSSELAPLRGAAAENDSSDDMRNSGFENDDIETGNAKECVICYNAIDTEQHNYMLTPCEHLFHDECLARWMDVKLECPVCRAQLPPLVLD